MAPSGEAIRIFVTVGSQLPFDRLVATVAHWARARPSVVVVAQVGRSALPADTLGRLNAVENLPPEAYQRHCQEANLIVAHAGMGSILTALELGRPLVVMPRRGHLAETRNDHQFDTARYLMGQRAPGQTGYILVALDERTLPDVLDQACLVQPHGRPTTASLSTSPASGQQVALCDSLRSVILQAGRR